MAGPLFKKHLIHQCVVQRPTLTQSTSGEPIPTWAAAGTPICRYVQQDERVAMPGVGFLMEQSDLMLFDSSADVREEDRIVTITLRSSGATVDAGPFSIEGAVLRNSTGAHHQSVRLRRIE